MFYFAVWGQVEVGVCEHALFRCSERGLFAGGVSLATGSLILSDIVRGASWLDLFTAAERIELVERITPQNP